MSKTAHTNKRDYLIKTLSRTNRKDYENYVIGAIWHKLDNLDIQPVTQQYVQCENGKYYLIDLYFPQINYAVECFEKYHFHSDEKVARDKLREATIEDQLTAIKKDAVNIQTVDVTKSIEEINAKIDEIVSEIKEKYIAAGSPRWNLDPTEEILTTGKIRFGDGCAFSTIVDIANRAFKKNYNGYQRCTFNVEGNAFVWCPKMAFKRGNVIIAGHRDWENTISQDHEVIYQKYIGIKPDLKDEDDRRDDTRNRLVFGWTRNPLGEYAYRFLGIYQVIGSNESITTMKRISTVCNLSDFRKH